MRIRAPKISLNMQLRLEHEKRLQLRRNNNRPTLVSLTPSGFTYGVRYPVVDHGDKQFARIPIYKVDEQVYYTEKRNAKC